MQRRILQVGTRVTGDVLEATALHVAEDTVGERGVPADVAVQFGEVRESEEEVLPAVVVEIVHPQTPTGQGAGGHQQSGALSPVF